MPDKKVIIFQIEDMLSSINKENLLSSGGHIEDGAAFLELLTNVLALLKPHELTKEEWETWKYRTKHRDPICGLWKEDTTPFWYLEPEDVPELAYLLGELKLFNGKPDIKEIKWK